ncbi:MAG: hypothetical protein B7X59_01205 [Polaromonas sp. 39-63-203]|jgi:hypothetical protein|nr:MAG: hypothetical protein B7X59_01205 [Polaromonas sp. 39-63-203]
MQCGVAEGPTGRSSLKRGESVILGFYAGVSADRLQETRGTLQLSVQPGRAAAVEAVSRRDGRAEVNKRF